MQGKQHYCSALSAGGEHGLVQKLTVSGQFAQKYVFAAQCIIALIDITPRVVYLDSLFLAGNFEYMARQQRVLSC